MYVHPPPQCHFSVCWYPNSSVMQCKTHCGDFLLDRPKSTLLIPSCDNMSLKVLECFFNTQTNQNFFFIGLWHYNYRDLFMHAVWPNPGHEAEASDLDLATQHKCHNHFIICPTGLDPPNLCADPTHPLSYPHRPHHRAAPCTLTEMLTAIFFPVFRSNWTILRWQKLSECNITFAHAISLFRSTYRYI